MEKPTLEQLQQLGIDADPDSLELERVERPKDGLARGATAQAAVPMAVDQFVAYLAGPKAAELTEVIPYSLKGFPDVKIREVPTSPGNFLLEADVDELVSYGSVAKVAFGSWAIGAGGGGVRLAPGGKPLALLFDTDIHRVRTARFRPGAAPEVTAPPVADWFTLAPGPTWLEAATVRAASSESRLVRAAAAANIMRLWFYAGPPDTTLQRMIERPRSPSDAGREWFASLEPTVRAELGSWTLDRAADLQLELDYLESRDDALAWLHARDDVASLTEALSLDSAQAEVVAAITIVLADLDDRAEQNPAWARFGPFDDARLYDVGTQDPGAWWGRLARY